MPTHAKAVSVTAQNTVTIADCTIPDPVADQILVRVSHSVISPGTELRCIAGNQANAADWGFIPGYANTGTVIAAGPEATVAIGTRVFARGTAHVDLPRMWGGHINHLVTASSQVIPVPENLEAPYVPLAVLAAIPLRGVRLAKAQVGDKVAVVGLGLIGQLSARLFAATGADVYAFDTDETRVMNAVEAGIKAFTIHGDLAHTAKTVMPSGFEILVEATGVPAVLRQLPALAKVGHP
jgi:2-desacetyl-2-hydroxyethyl bacteriochlorophyllide A dehydrogenase